MHRFRSKQPALDDWCEFWQTPLWPSGAFLADLNAWGVMWGATRLLLTDLETRAP